MVAEPGARPAGSYQSAGRGSAGVELAGSRWGTGQIPLMSHWERFTDYTNLTDEPHFQSAGLENQDESWMLYSYSSAFFFCVQLPGFASVPFRLLFMFTVVLSALLTSVVFMAVVLFHVISRTWHQSCSKDLKNYWGPNSHIRAPQQLLTSHQPNSVNPQIVH